MTQANSLSQLFVTHYLKKDNSNPFIRISAILAFVGIALGVAVLILSMSVMNGMQKEFQEKLFVMNYPITLVSRDASALDDELIEQLKNRFPDIKISPFYQAQVIAKNDNGVQGMLLYGVNFTQEKAINSVFLSATKNLTQAGSFDMIIGKGLKEELLLSPKSKLLIYFPQNTAIGFGTMPLQKRFKTTAFFDSGLSSYDKAIGYTTLRAFRKILKYPKGYYSGFHIYTKEPQELIEKLKKLLPQEVIAQGWWEQNSSFYAAMRMEKVAMYFILLLIILVASLNIISSTLMTVMSRRSEIALLITMGATPKEIKSIFLKLGLSLGIGGIIAGLFVGFGGIAILSQVDLISLPADIYGTTKLPTDVKLLDIVVIVVGSAAVVLLASFYPAKKAASTDPLEVLRSH